MISAQKNSIFTFFLAFLLFFANSKVFATNSLDHIYQKYQKEQLLYSIDQVNAAINDVIPHIPNLQRKRLSVIIALACKDYDIDPRIIISIIYVESGFKQSAKSQTGDFSIAQINFKVWDKSFKKLKRSPLNFKQLKEDETYAIYRMAEILNYLKSNKNKKDKYWFAEYHSKTPLYKNRYIKLLQRPLKKLIKYGPDLLDNIPDDPNAIINNYLNV